MSDVKNVENVENVENAEPTERERIESEITQLRDVVEGLPEVAARVIKAQIESLENKLAQLEAVENFQKTVMNFVAAQAEIAHDKAWKLEVTYNPALDDAHRFAVSVRNVRTGGGKHGAWKIENVIYTNPDDALDKLYELATEAGQKADAVKSKIDNNRKYGVATVARALGLRDKIEIVPQPEDK